MQSRGTSFSSASRGFDAAEHREGRRGKLGSRRRRRCYCTLTLTEALPVSMNVHVFTLFPALEQAPDQIALRPFETLRVIDVPVANVAEPVLPTATLIPAGLEVTRSPLRPVAVTVTVAD